MNDKKKKPEREYNIFWLVGESSGDLHAELLMKNLNSAIPELHHVGIGGPRMQRQGLRPILPFNRFAVMGFAEVLAHLPFFITVQNKIRSLFARSKPDLVILVDYPGLNMRVAKLADQYRIPVLYFICPQFWAWKYDRVYKLRDYTQHVACILPFEKALLDKHEVTCSYVGHPIAEEVKFDVDRNKFAALYKLDPTKKWIGFFPGSRNDEIARMLPVYLKAAAKWDSKQYELIFSKARCVEQSRYMEHVSKSAGRHFKIIDGYTYEMMKYCEALVCTSGTVTLEAAFIGTPMIICYRSSELSFSIGKRLVNIKRIGLPNIVLDQSLLPELVQNDMTPDAIFKHIDNIIHNASLNNHIRNELAKLQGMLSDKKPSIEVPLIVKDLLHTYA